MSQASATVNVTGAASPSASAFEFCGPRSFRVRELGFIKANKLNMKKNTENHRKRSIANVQIPGNRVAARIHFLAGEPDWSRKKVLGECLTSLDGMKCF